MNIHQLSYNVLPHQCKVLNFVLNTVNKVDMYGNWGVLQPKLRLPFEDCLITLYWRRSTFRETVEKSRVRSEKELLIGGCFLFERLHSEKTYRRFLLGVWALTTAPLEQYKLVWNRHWLTAESYIGVCGIYVHRSCYLRSCMCCWQSHVCAL